MLEVKFYEMIDESLFKFAVIISRHNGKWVFCKHKEILMKYRVATGKIAKTY